ncbi:MAG: hypothetical protein IPL78_12235 [Chloroflexi bacterium]|nr:hypothetical protein [Chloroflexota bacterium]
MLWTIIVILLILWLLGFWGKHQSQIPPYWQLIHILIVIAVILLILQLIGAV